MKFKPFLIVFAFVLVCAGFYALLYFTGKPLTDTAGNQERSQNNAAAYPPSFSAPVFAANNSGGFVAKNTLFEATLPQNSKEAVKITKERTLSFTPTNSQSVQAQTNGNKILYPDAYPSADIEYVTTTKGIKESIILKSNTNIPEKFTYRFDAKDLKATLGSDNSITFTQISKEPPKDIPVSDGTILPAQKAANFLPEYPQRFKTAPPVMIDANGKRSATSDVKVTLTENTLVLKPSKAWLQKAKFPVTLDPTVETTPQIVQEAANKRTATSKDFLNDDGTYTMVIFQNPLHYQDGNTLKDIDRTFRQSTDPNYQYEVTTGIYVARVKKTLTGNNSDIQLAFSGANIGFSPTKIGWSNGDSLGTVQNVNGEISGDGTTVTYKSMFGIPGIDLEAIYDNEKFLKETVINNAQSIQVSSHTNDNLEISFTLDLPANVDLKVDGKIWDKSSTIETMDKIVVLNNGQEISDLRKAIAYSQNPTDPQKPGEGSQVIKVRLSKDNNRLILTKIISGVWLSKVTYPIRTDTTDTIYGIAGDGLIGSVDGLEDYEGWDGSYLPARAGTGDGWFAAVSSDGNDLPVGQGQFYDYYTAYGCYEGFIGFNTEPVGSDTVSAATLSLYLLYDYSTQDFTTQARLKTWSAGGLTTADWIAGASLTGQTLVAHLTSAGIGAAGYKDFVDDAFTTNINGSGNTELILHSDRHSGNNAPNTAEYIYWDDADYTGTTHDPKLVVVHAPAGPTSTPTPTPTSAATPTPTPMTQIKPGVRFRPGVRINMN